MCCVDDCNVKTHPNIFVLNISLLVEARANIPTLFMINLKFTKSILVPIILYFPWLLYAHYCNADTHANFISKCVVGTVSVKSVYTCTAQTVQFSRGQCSHYRLYTVQCAVDQSEAWKLVTDRTTDRTADRHFEILVQGSLRERWTKMNTPPPQSFIYSHRLD